VDALAGDGQRASAADASLDAGWVRMRVGAVVRRGGRHRCGPGRRGQGVGQTAQHHAICGDLHDPTVEADGDAPVCEVVADGALPAGEVSRAGDVDQAVELDRFTSAAPAAVATGVGRAGWPPSPRHPRSPLPAVPLPARRPRL
jgi:hypothetical protein